MTLSCIGEAFIHVTLLYPQAGPSKKDLSSVGYAYASTVDEWAHRTLGLEGFLVVARRGELGANLLPKGVDYLIPVIWQVG